MSRIRPPSLRTIFHFAGKHGVSIIVQVSIKMSNNASSEPLPAGHFMLKLSRIRRAGAADTGVRLQERYPMRLAHFPAPVSVKRFFRRQRKNFTQRHFDFIPLENKHPLWPQNAEALRETLAQHFTPIAAQHSILFLEPARVAATLNVGRIKDDVRESIIGKW